MKVQDSEIMSIDIEVNDSDVLQRVRSEYTPEEVFTEDELDTWATQNGYVPEDEKEE